MGEASPNNLLQRKGVGPGLPEFIDVIGLLLESKKEDRRSHDQRVKTTDLVDDIRKVGAGESLLDADMTERLFERLRTGPKQDPLLSRLSNQEQVIVDHIAAGLTNRQIAEEMFLAEKTVKNYVSNLLAKMDMSRRSEAAAYVARLEGEKDAEPAEDWDQT